MGETLIDVQQGAATVAEVEGEFLGLGSDGDPEACRILRFPSSVSAELAPIVYSVAGVCRNPDRTFNLDNAVLPHPRTRVVETLGSTRVNRFERFAEDVVVTEVWNGSDSVASMSTALFRAFYEYLINARLIPALGPTFIEWEPRDRNDRIYSVELLSLTVGAGTDESRFDVVDFRDSGGDTIQKAVDSLNTLATGIVDRSVTQRMRIIADVTP